MRPRVMRYGLWEFNLDTLQALGSPDGLHNWELQERTGWCLVYCRASIYRLRDLNLAEKREFHGKWQLTERGKIVLAIIVGKESRRRFSEKAAA